jgi:hypothetical protein
MALYRGPSLIGLLGGATASSASENVTTIPAQWLASTVLERGVETWFLGALCLIGHCFLVGAYLVTQVLEMLELICMLD